MPYQNPVEDISLTIPNGTSASDAAALDGRAVIGLQTPAGWTAAGISFEVSEDAATWVPLFAITTPGTAAEITIPSSAVPTLGSQREFALDAGWTLGWRYLRVISGVGGAGVNQGAARTLKLRVRGI